jgi:sugar phosphate isomerase/epimerase
MARERAVERPEGLDRRAFLRAALTSTAALGAVGGLAPIAGADELERGGHGHGWHRIPRERIGVQLYTLRSIIEADVEGTLQAVADIGYAEVELAGLYGLTAQEFRAILDRVGLRAISSHIGLDVIRGDFDAAIADALVLGQEWIICPWVPPELRTPEEYRRMADDFTAAAIACRRAGLQFGYHNHDFDFDVVDGVRLFDILARRTDRRLVDFELDLYWAHVAGVDPLSLFRRYPRRFPLFHVKDADEEGFFADVGEGVIDFARIFRRRALSGTRHWIVENDQPDEPIDSIADSYENLRALRF